MKTDLYKSGIGKNLKKIRDSRGLSTTDIAKILKVSQAKISYVENGKGVLSGVEIALLSRNLNIPILEFFAGLDDSENEEQKLVHHLIHFGAAHFATPKGIIQEIEPFENIFVKALSFLEDERIHQGFITAWIVYAGKHEINVDRIFTQIGSSAFLVKKVFEEADLALKVLDLQLKNKKIQTLRAKAQIGKIQDAANKVSVSSNWRVDVGFHEPISSLSGYEDFLLESLNASK